MADKGYWGPITASVDWCESNYEHTQYVAELFNTISSLPVAIMGLYAYKRSKGRYGLLYNIACVGMIIIGLGSASFHGTLLRECQMLDEIPMLWGICGFCLLTCAARSDTTSRNRWITSIFCWAVFCTVMYFIAGFVMFIVLYSITVAMTIAASYYQCTRSVSTHHAVLLRRYAFLAAGIYTFGFLFLWIPEQILCGNRLHNSTPSVLQSLHFHAFFHLCSAIGPYLFLCFAAILHLDHLQHRVEIIWRRHFETLYISCPGVEPAVV
eukprot:TRINITY_DN2239_c2_g2_i2.p1 TRINITY_DN2239_c2_g2~~TRINITY_DN2239_c2_g2_i2.p1  ORF type:complete len:267 (+),score=2.85 TRINITY_DN2239_c2_g2_i2:53-853(+)